MSYVTAILDECGYVIEYCCNMTDDEVMDALINHPEWRRACIPQYGAYDF